MVAMHVVIFIVDPLTVVRPSSFSLSHNNKTLTLLAPQFNPIDFFSVP